MKKYSVSLKYSEGQEVNLSFPFKKRCWGSSRRLHDRVLAAWAEQIRMDYCQPAGWICVELLMKEQRQHLRDFEN